jgi:hypothetical protein
MVCDSLDWLFMVPLVAMMWVLAVMFVVGLASVLFGRNRSSK